MSNIPKTVTILQSASILSTLLGVILSIQQTIIQEAKPLAIVFFMLSIFLYIASLIIQVNHNKKTKKVKK